MRNVLASSVANKDSGYLWMRYRANHVPVPKQSVGSQRLVVPEGLPADRVSEDALDQILLVVRSSHIDGMSRSEISEAFSLDLTCVANHLDSVYARALEQFVYAPNPPFIDVPLWSALLHWCYGLEPRRIARVLGVELREGDVAGSIEAEKRYRAMEARFQVAVENISVEMGYSVRTVRHWLANIDPRRHRVVPRRKRTQTPEVDTQLQLWEDRYAR